MKRGFTLIELLVVIAIIAILASILFPVFAKARAKARQATCTSQVRQIATAVQMYAQDNQGQYPGVDGGSWSSKLTNYLGNSDKMFQCPEDTSGTGRNSYAFAGVLIRTDGSGVKEANVFSPSEVGCVCDAAPTELYPSGRLIGGGALTDEAVIAATPAARHGKGTVAGYCDGHAKYIPGTFVENDMANEIARGFYQVASLGLVDNPTGCLASGSALVGSATGSLVLGGEYVTYPLLSAAGALYTGGNVFTRGFLGQTYTTARPDDGSWAWGQANGLATLQADLPYTAIAYDAVCVIVSKGTKIPTGTLDGSGYPGLGTYSNDTYVVGTTTICDLFGRGYQQGTVQAYRMGDKFSTTGTIKYALGWTGDFGTESITVANDLEMVDKVANDPYGIGYCSTVFADPTRVTILGLVNASDPTKPYIWPRSSTKFRWVMPTMAESTWPWKRALQVDVKANSSGTGAMIKANLEGGAIMNNLELGPLFKMGYWPGRP
jgi:prepilin-type N-terminal cleavage/methylation domain-containing protein/prepilin-type processing-associated H-X9-DG protein